MAKLPPWHLWGVSQVVPLNPSPTDASQGVTVTSQLCKINLKYPTAFSFLFWAKVVNFNGVGIPPGTLLCHFDLQMGVGRDVAIIPDFAVLQPAVNNVAAIVPGAIAWTSTVEGVGAVLANGTAYAPIIDRVTARDIQVQCRAAIAGAGAGWQVQVEVGAQLAPTTHVRPDWFVRHFAGEETGGS